MLVLSVWLKYYKKKLEVSVAMLKYRVLIAHPSISVKYSVMPLFVIILQLAECLDQTIALKRWKDGWIFCSQLNTKEHWMKLGYAALKCLDVDFGMETIGCFIKLNVPGLHFIIHLIWLKFNLNTFKLDFTFVGEIYQESKNRIKSLPYESTYTSVVFVRTKQ